MKKRLLSSKLPYDVIEKMGIYRLGVFRNHSFDVVELRRNTYYPPHFHKRSTATFYVTFGHGYIIVGKKQVKYKPGNVFRVGKGVQHGFKPRSDTLVLSVQTPPIKSATGKEDIKFIPLKGSDKGKIYK
jgi:quercetin dioxygenase-like cupin family protein